MRKILKLVALVVLVCGTIFAYACGGEGKQARIKGNSSYEASLFRQNCVICHGPEGEGRMMNGQQVPSLRKGEPATRTGEEIYKQIAFGKLPMPPFRDQLTESEMRRLATFIKEELQGRTD